MKAGLTTDEPDMYLGAKMKSVTLENNVTARGLSSSEHVLYVPGCH